MPRPPRRVEAPASLPRLPGEAPRQLFPLALTSVVARAVIASVVVAAEAVRELPVERDAPPARRRQAAADRAGWGEGSGATRPADSQLRRQRSEANGSASRPPPCHRSLLRRVLRLALSSIAADMCTRSSLRSPQPRAWTREGRSLDRPSFRQVTTQAARLRRHPCHDEKVVEAAVALHAKAYFTPPTPKRISGVLVPLTEPTTMPVAGS